MGAWKERSVITVHYDAPEYISCSSSSPGSSSFPSQPIAYRLATCCKCGCDFTCDPKPYSVPICGVCLYYVDKKFIFKPDQYVRVVRSAKFKEVRYDFVSCADEFEGAMGYVVDRKLYSDANYYGVELPGLGSYVFEERHLARITDRELHEMRQEFACLTTKSATGLKSISQNPTGTDELPGS
jgi:hypothetical protein